MDDKGLVAFASDLLLCAGEWPSIINVVDEKDQMFRFLRTLPIIHNGEFGGYYYVTKDAKQRFTVFND
jgi:hypothetical protein